MTRPQKWTQHLLLLALALLIGFAVGVLDTIFGRVLLAIGDLRTHYFFYLIPFLAVAGLWIVFLYKKWGETAGQGMSLVFEVGQGASTKIPKRLIPLIILSTWLTHLFGGSAGREGVAVQLGATVANRFTRFLKLADAQHILIVTGMAAGFSGLFQIPLAATFFALEVLVVGRYSIQALLPAAVASFTASFTSHALGLEKFSHLLAIEQDLTPLLLAQLIFLGICFGLIGNLFAWALKQAKHFFAQLLPNPYWRIGLMGIGLSILLLLLWQGRYSGLGTNLIDLSLSGQDIQAYDWLLKLILTVLTLAAGFQGGEVTPLFAIGATSGAVLASLIGLPVEFAAALGYLSVFGAATNTLLAPIFIGGEVFGFANTASYAIVAITAFLIHQGQSIYGKQKYFH